MGEPQRQPWPRNLRAHIIRVIDAIIDDDQVTTKKFVEDLIAALPDPLQYKGTWDANTNTPTLLNTDTDVAGFVYRCNVAGSVDFGAGSITFTVGDFAVNNGTIWEKWDAGDIVSSVFTRVGAITAQSGDYTHAQIGSVGADDHHVKYTDAEALLAAFANIDTKSFENLLLDGDFEGSIVSSHWVSSGTIAKNIESSIVKIGAQAVKLSVPAPVPTAASIYQDVVDYTRYQGRVVTFNVWARCPAGNTFDSVIEIDDGVGVTTSSVIPKDDTYHLMSITHTMDAAASKLSAIVHLRKTPATSTTDLLYADGCILVEGDSCPAYGDCSPLYQDITGIFRGAMTLAGVLPTDADVATWNTRDRGFGRASASGRNYLMWKDVGGIRYKELSNDGIVTLDNGDSPYSGGTLKMWNTYLCDATLGAIAFNLPVAHNYEGMVFKIKKIDGSANAVTITPNGIETIDGAASKVLSTQYEYIEFLSDGTEWHVLYPTPTVDPNKKAGIVAGGSFAGNPKKFIVTFNTAMPNNNYAISVLSEDSRNWTVESKAAAGFTMNANSNLVFANNVFWIARQINDP